MSTNGLCLICTTPEKRKWVERRLAEGRSFNATARLSREDPKSPGPMKDSTISRHAHHMHDPDRRPGALVAPPPLPAKVHPLAPEDRPQGSDDVATLVQRAVVEKMKDPDGGMRVTVQHGLQAQALLDRRAERAKDRELSITLARMLHSPLPPPDVIEGSARDVTPASIEP